MGNEIRKGKMNKLLFKQKSKSNKHSTLAQEERTEHDHSLPTSQTTK